MKKFLGSNIGIIVMSVISNFNNKNEHSLFVSKTKKIK
uniref:Uncharacterized protein n=1 Tax=viral metagenome TaxID=1070528 RepID=A0A6C0EUI1_9ZZZZ